MRILLNNLIDPGRGGRSSCRFDGGKAATVRGGAAGNSPAETYGNNFRVKRIHQCWRTGFKIPLASWKDERGPR